MAIKRSTDGSDPYQTKIDDMSSDMCLEFFAPDKMEKTFGKDSQLFANVAGAYIAKITGATYDFIHHAMGEKVANEWFQTVMMNTSGILQQNYGHNIDFLMIEEEK